MIKDLLNVDQKMEAYIAMLQKANTPQKKLSEFLDSLGFKNEKDRFKFVAAASLKRFDRRVPTVEKLKR